MVAPPSISEELDTKLAQLDTIYDALREVTHSLPTDDDTPVGLEAAEKALLTLRVKKGGVRLRFIGVIEAEVSRTIAQAPAAPLPAVFGYVVANALLWKEGAKLGSRPSSVEFLSEPKPDYAPLIPPIPDVRGADLIHIRACQELGEREQETVVFLVLERPVYNQKTEIEARFPRVKVTNPAFLDSYLSRI